MAFPSVPPCEIMLRKVFPKKMKGFPKAKPKSTLRRKSALVWQKCGLAVDWKGVRIFFLHFNQRSECLLKPHYAL